MTDYVQGIDVSHYNGNVNWSQVAGAAGQPQFVYLKATEGCSEVDSQYQSNRAGARQHGLLRGAYHFFVPGVPVAAQVSHFCQTVRSVAGELPPMLDIEQAGLARPDYASAVTEWLQQVAAQLHCLPGIYTSADFWNDRLGSFADFRQYPLWIAHYTDDPSPRLPTGAGQYAFWQYAEAGTVSGIHEPVDMNRFCGTPDQLRKLVSPP